MPKGRILFPWEIIIPGDWNRTFERKTPHTSPPEEGQTQRGQQDPSLQEPVFRLKKKMPKNKIHFVMVNKKTIKDMANHIVGRKMPKNKEKTYDADGDGKITLKDFIHRIKNVAGADDRQNIEVVAPYTKRLGR